MAVVCSFSTILLLKPCEGYCADLPNCVEQNSGHECQAVPTFGLFDPSNDSPINTAPGSKAQLKLSGSTDENVTAEGRVGVTVWSTGRAVPQALLLDVVLKGPLNKSGDAELASLSGLENSTTVSVGGTFSSWVREPTISWEEQTAACAEYYCMSGDRAETIVCEGIKADLEMLVAAGKHAEEKSLYGVTLTPEEALLLKQRQNATVEIAKLDQGCAAYLRYGNVQGMYESLLATTRQNLQARVDAWKALGDGVGRDRELTAEEAEVRRRGIEADEELRKREALAGSSVDRSAQCVACYVAQGGELDEDFPCQGSQLEGEFRTRFEDATDNPPLVLVSGRGTVGRESFSYLEEGSLAERMQNETPYALELGLGVFQPAMGLIAANYKYQESYQATEARDICSPLAGTEGAIACRSASLGAPDKIGSNILTLEWRKYVFAPYVALNPKVNVDLQSDVVGLEMPVYFLMNSEGLLNGGIRVGWRSDTREVTAVAFVGSAFNFPGLD